MGKNITEKLPTLVVQWMEAKERGYGLRKFPEGSIYPVPK